MTIFTSIYTRDFIPICKLQLTTLIEGFLKHCGMILNDEPGARLFGASTRPIIDSHISRIFKYLNTRKETLRLIRAIKSSIRTAFLYIRKQQRYFTLFQLDRRGRYVIL